MVELRPQEKPNNAAKAVLNSASSDRPYVCPFAVVKKLTFMNKLNLHLRKEHPGHNPEEGYKTAPMTAVEHWYGKSRLKFDVRSYQEMVVIPMKQMSEDNQQLTYLKNKVVKEKEISKALHDIFVVVSQKLRETSEENQIVRLITKIQQEEIKEMMDCQERFFKDQIDRIHKHTEEKERRHEKLLQEERAKAKFTDSNCNAPRSNLERISSNPSTIYQSYL
ncbi:hypothetical protein KFK09_012812 [Dendrobium nobile]|uniref:Uncharacterized protein n=1 Tax=Dendrobium nobile TaxID=94219 RepID=A0A8T3BIH1_DENNO|nr:hypothetical protein KFK09_012812 [Dendrobium nobile]